jgi:O-antigen ligase
LTSVALPHRGETYAPLLFAVGCLLLALGLSSGRTLPAAGLSVLVFGLATVSARPVVPWRWLIAAVVAIIIVVPIRRYTLPSSLPFELEPYRLVIGLVLMAWFASLLVDQRVRVRASGFEGPLAVIFLSAVASVVVNAGRVADVPANVMKSMMFFASFLLVFYFVVSVARTWSDVDFIVKLVVLGSAGLSLLAIIEYRMQWTPFGRLGDWVPFLEAKTFIQEDARAGRFRAQASAEHPIAFSALLAIVTPLTIYLVQRYGRRWLLATALLLAAAMATVSRTGVVMIAVGFLALLWMRPRQVWRWLPLLIPLLLAVKLLAPGAIGTLRYYFDPAEGIVANQSTSKNSIKAANRLNDLGPSLEQIARQPLLGQGYGTRLRGDEFDNARVLDNQWLGTLLDVGFIGFFGWVWLFARVVRRLGRSARGDPSREGWLRVGLAAGILSFAVGMATYDAFTFVQVTFVLYLLVAIAALVSRPGALIDDRAPRAPGPAAPEAFVAAATRS